MTRNLSVQCAFLVATIVGAGACAGTAPVPAASVPPAPVLAVAPPEVVSAPAAPIVREERSQLVGGPREVVASLHEEFSSCYQGGLWLNPAQRGSVRLELDIDAVGHPKGVNSSGGKGLDRRVVACLHRVAAGAMFAPPKGGATTVFIPLTFASR